MNALATSMTSRDSHAARPAWYVRMLNPRVAVPIALALLLLAAPFVYREWQIAGLPDPGDPFDVEAFLAANPSAPREDNAIADYIAAENIVHGDPSDFSAYLGLRGELACEHDSIPPAAWHWLASNRRALELWETGARKSQRWNLSHRDADGWVFDDDGNLPLLVLLQLVKLERDGNWNEFQEWNRKVLRFGCHLAFHDALSGGDNYRSSVRSGTQFRKRYRECLFQLAMSHRLDAAQLKQLLNDVTTAFQKFPPLSETLKTMYLRDSWYLSTPDYLIVDTDHGKPTHTSLFLQNDPERSHRLLKHGYGNFLRYCDLPLPKRPRSSTDWMYDEPGWSGRRGVLLEEDVNSWARRLLVYVSLELWYADDVIDAWTSEVASQECLQAGLAVLIFLREKGRLPMSFEEMRDAGIIPKVPLDPWARNASQLQFQRNEKDVRIWSVGRSGDEDGDFEVGFYTSDFDLNCVGIPADPDVAEAEVLERR
jgi:hypothetical protein